ncbi:type I-E CRISPR-associated protein Cas6/Cse3/CasE [Dactylosporangium sp. CA-152071]|uniref:type I-E CRISPR-associated protein Cas6/Cse3/CasE n=1 Tax=Dactylosporangium sp. CA-152071 TaxID=3239933 RepID=UPI003D9123F2
MTAIVTAQPTPTLAAVPLNHPALIRHVRDWGDRDQIHKAVMTLFRPDLPGPQDQRRGTAGILYRVEHRPHPRILLQAATPLARTDYGIRVTDLTGLMANLQPGRRVHLRVDINAVRCESRTGRRLAVPDSELQGWLTARLESGLNNVEILDAPVTVSRAGNHPLRVAHIAATATVHDSSALTELINNGVGRGKAYGCGLLTVLPA